jgi:hypothetical protein
VAPGLTLTCAGSGVTDADLNLYSHPDSNRDTLSSLRPQRSVYTNSTMRANRRVCLTL